MFSNSENIKIIKIIMLKRLVLNFVSLAVTATARNFNKIMLVSLKRVSTVFDRETDFTSS